ncbi:MAG: chemotaxis protein CheB [Promethearchaeota archaeon]
MISKKIETPIKVIIIDDSKFMRVFLKKMINKYEYITVIKIFSIGLDAINFIRKNNPVDVILLDLFMPKLNGIETFKKINNIHKIPTIMITSADRKENAELFFHALHLGVFDVILKPSNLGLGTKNVKEVEEKVIQQIQNAHLYKNKLDSIHQAQFQIKNLINKRKDYHEKQKMESNKEFIQEDYSQYLLKSSEVIPKLEKKMSIPPFLLIVIGASTGGPPLVSNIISNLTFNPNTAILIIQHMPKEFTNYFAQRLDKTTKYKIEEIKDRMELNPGNGYVAPGNFHVEIEAKNDIFNFHLNQSPKIHSIRPAIDFSLPSIAKCFNKYANVIVLSGMGNDGSSNIHYIKEFGGKVFAQKPSEALIENMPLNVIKTGNVDEILSIHEIIYNLNQTIQSFGGEAQ